MSGLVFEPGILLSQSRSFNHFIAIFICDAMIPHRRSSPIYLNKDLCGLCNRRKPSLKSDCRIRKRTGNRKGIKRRRKRERRSCYSKRRGIIRADISVFGFQFQKDL
jgi:hypothetical protein